MNIQKNKFKKVVSGTLVFASMLLSVTGSAKAANMTSASVLLSGSRPSQAATTYTLGFKPGTGGTLRCTEVVYSTSPTLFGAGTAPGGLSTGAPSTLGSLTGLAGSYTLTNVTAYSQTIASAAGDTVTTATVIAIPLAAMVNPTTAQTYFARISTFTDQACTTAMDSVVVAFAITTGTTVSATVDPSLVFVVNGIAPAAFYKNAVPVSLLCTDTATAVTFPVNMASGSAYTCAQSLTTSTNATSGYTVTLRGTHTSTNFMKATVNEITNAAGTNASPVAWIPATESFGYTTSDSVLGTGTTGRFAADDTWAQVPIATSPAEVAFAAGPVNGDVANIGYKIEFIGTTKAGSYSGTIVYVATPVF